MMNIIEALVAQRTEELSFKSIELQKKIDKFEREEEVRETRLRQIIRKEF